MHETRGVISFAHCGSAGRIDLSSLALDTGRFLAMPTEMMPAVLQFPTEAFYPARKQYHAGVILNHLAVQHPRYLRVVGITPCDLFLPIFTHVYGEAQMPGRAALVSLYRLESEEAADSNRDMIFLRALKITIHELLHTFEITHCHHTECLMQPVTMLSQLDLLSLRLCRSCNNLWERLKSHLQANPGQPDAMPRRP